MSNITDVLPEIAEKIEEKKSGSGNLEKLEFFQRLYADEIEEIQKLDVLHAEAIKSEDRREATRLFYALVDLTEPLFGALEECLDGEEILRFQEMLEV